MQTVEQRAIAEAKTFMRHGGLCGIVGGYGYCTCGMDEAVAALDALPPSGIAEMVREMCAKVAEDHVDNSKKIRHAKEDRMGRKLGDPETFAEERGENIAANLIASVIRSLDLSNKGVG